MEKVNILDFTDNGGAIIEVPQIDSDYSIVINHWESVDIELQKIEQDILQSDSPQRTNFLKKCAKEIQQFINIEVIASNKLFLSYEIKKDYGSEEERQYYEEEQSKNIEYGKDKCINIYNFELKHSLSWYLMNQMDNEIEKIEQQIEIQKGLLKVYKSSDDVFPIIRESKSDYYATDKLMKHFSLSKPQAKIILNMTMRELIDLDKQKIESKIKFLECLKSFLGKLKE